MRLPCWGAICSLLIGWAPVFADQPAETLPGFHPENLLEAHGIDNVNLFNGDPGVVIPLGPEYIGGPSYRWQLKAYYSAKLWTMSTCDLENDTGQAAWVRGDPTLGAGWTMQVGYVETQYYLADQTTAFSWTYVSPDGGRHEVFFGTGTVAYTLDATRLRVTVSPTAAHPTQYTVEFRDGSIQTLSHISGPPLPSPPSSSPDFRNIGYPSPVEKRFGLTSVQDSFRNTVLSVGYDSTYPDEVTTVTLTPNTQSKAVTFHWKAMTIGTATWRVMDYVEFDTVSGQKQRATFGQQSGTFPRNNFDRGPSGCFATGASVQVPELSSVTFSDPATSPSFPSFSHSFTYWPDASGDQIPVQRQGALWQLTLPTGGTITYEYGSTTQNQCEIVSAGNCDPETS